MKPRKARKITKARKTCTKWGCESNVKTRRHVWHVDLWWEAIPES